jgi:predicted nucleic acid-binding protein
LIYLLDTNVISELRKPRPHGAVLAWRKSVPVEQIAIPAVVISEIQEGIEIARKQDSSKAGELEAWLDRVVTYYTILPADARIYREWARLMHGKSSDLGADAMLAATARAHRLIVATRNVKDFASFGVRVFNPFSGK